MFTKEIVYIQLEGNVYKLDYPIVWYSDHEVNYE